jgi:hypothetical protein
MSFLSELFGPNDLLEFRFIADPQGGGRTSIHYVNFGDRNAVRSLLEHGGRLNADERASVHVGVHSRIMAMVNKGGEPQCAKFLFADFDDVPVERAAECWASIGEEPSIVVNSGHGIHCYWRLEQPMYDLGHWSACQHALFERCKPAVGA